jgi:hypothetical protein
MLRQLAQHTAQIRQGIDAIAVATRDATSALAPDRPPLSAAERARLHAMFSGAIATIEAARNAFTRLQEQMDHTLDALAARALADARTSETKN